MKKQILVLCVLALLFAVGCGEDKGSAGAKNLDSSNNLDSGNYMAVLNDPNAAATDYATAAMGLAGLDPIDLVKAMNDISTTATKNDLNQVAALPINPDALPYLQLAKAKLGAELALNPIDPNLNFQMTLTSITSTMTSLAQVGKNNVSGFDPSNGISTTEANALGTYIANNPSVTVNTGAGITDTLVNVVSGDVTNVDNTLPNANLGAGSDLNTVLTQATQGPQSLNYDGTGSVTSTDISNYVKNVLGQ